jgi:hypothetical protein
MARSKTRVYDIENNGEYITAQFELENGEVVIGGYKCVLWYQAPEEKRQDTIRRLSNVPVGTFGKLKAPDQ